MWAHIKIYELVSNGEEPQVNRTKFGGRGFVIFARQFATLVRAGIPIPDALDTLSTQYETTVFGEVLNEVSNRVISGFKLSAALATYPLIFSPVFVAMVKIGEESGQLDVTFEKLADWRERDYELLRQVKGALVYPVFVLLITFALTFFLFYYIMPKFMGVVTDLETELPAITQLALDISDGVRSPVFWLVSTILMVSVVTLLKRAMATPHGRAQLFSVLHHLPLFGLLIRLTAVSRFAAALETLLEAGLNLRKVIELGAESSGNPLVVIAGKEMNRQLTEGEHLAPYILERTDLFPGSFGHYVATGEESSRLPTMMGAAARMYEEDVSYRLEGLVALLEPILMAIVALIVGFVIIAMASCTMVLFQ